MNVKKALKEPVDPEEDWLMFSLIKVKLKDGNLLCIWLIGKILAFYCFDFGDILFLKVYQDDGHY